MPEKFDKDTRANIHHRLGFFTGSDVHEYVKTLEEIAKAAMDLWEEHPSDYPRSEADKKLYVALAKVDWMRE